MNDIPLITKVLVPYMLAYHGGVHCVLSNGLPRLNEKVDLVVEYAELCSNQADMDSMEQLGVPVNRGVGVAGSGVLSYQGGLRKKIDHLISIPRLLRIMLSITKTARNYDVLYVHGYRELLLVTMSLFFINFRARSSIVWHCHGIAYGALPRFLVSLANRCNKVIAISDSVADCLAENGIHPDLICVVHNAALIDHNNLTHTPSNLPKRFKPSRATVILLPSSSIREDKGISIAVEAMSGLPEEVELWITGNEKDNACVDYIRSLKELIDEKALSSRVHFIGRRTDIHSVMSASDIVLVPSLCREGFGLVAAEAMLIGKPVVVSCRGALPEVVGSSEFGWVFDPSDPKALLNCLLDILSHPLEKRKRGDNGKSRAETLFSYDRWSQKVSNILRQADIRKTKS